MVSRSQIGSTRRKALSALGGLLETAGPRMMMKSVRAGKHFNSWRERVPDFRSCNAEV